MVGGRIKIGMKEPVAHFVTAVRPSKPTSLLPLLIEGGGGGGGVLIHLFPSHPVSFCLLPNHK